MRSIATLILFLAGAAAAQDVKEPLPALSACTLPDSPHEAERCVRNASPRGLKKLDPTHEYTLPEWIDLAESNSPEGRIAWARAKASLEQAGVARAAYLPIVALALQGSDVRAIVPFPEPIAPRGYVTVEEPTLAAQLQLEYTLLDVGRGARLDAARATQLADTLRFGRTQQQIAFTISTLYYKEQLEAAKLTAARTILHDAETLRDNAQSQLENGRATLPDVQNATAGAAEAQFSLVAAEGAVQKAKLALTEAAGVEPTTEIEVPPQPTSITPEVLKPQVESLIESAWKQRPDLLAKAQDLKRAQQTAKAAHSAYMPTVKLEATGGQTTMWPTADYGTVGYANVSTWAAAASLRWEIFNGARGHEVAKALAEQHAAEEEQRSTQDRVTREVWQSYVDYETAEEQQRAATAYLASSQISYDSSLDAFGYGVRSLVDVVQAERQLAQARIAAVNANAALSFSATALTFALGARP